MALKIRLQRFGSTKRPFYRIVAAESQRARDGKFLEIVGTYNPLTGVVEIKQEVYNTWISKGAKPSDTVKSLLKKQK